MIESWAIRLEMGILLFSSVLFSNPSSELGFVDGGLQYGGFEKKDAKKIAFVHKNRYFNLEKLSELSWDTTHGWIKAFYFQNVH